jgi:hypothetical protein
MNREKDKIQSAKKKKRKEEIQFSENIHFYELQVISFLFPVFSNVISHSLIF